MNKQQRIIFILAEVLLVSLVILRFSRETIVLFGIMQLIFLIIQKVYLIKNELFHEAKLLRRTIYFIPCFISFLILMPRFPDGKNIKIFLVSAVIVGIIFLVPRIKEFKIFYNREFVTLLPPITLKTALIEAYSYLGSAITQELFYKSFIIAILYPLVGIIPAILISAFLFMAEHILHFATEDFFQAKDYLVQFLFSITTGFLYVYSGFVLVPILAHLTYNIPIMFSYFFRFSVSKQMEGGVKVV